MPGEPAVYFYVKVCYGRADDEPLVEEEVLFPLKPSFNHLTANFADEEFEFVTNSFTLYDIDHAKLIGGATSPLFRKSNVNLSGTASKSQAGRIVAIRLREELGGITLEQWKAARQVSFRTTVLALNTEPGMVCSMTHPDMPDGVINGNPTPSYGEFRVTGWRLNKDYSIDIQGRTSTDEMYDLIAGPKPADVPADPVPVEFAQLPLGLVWHPDAVYPDADDPLFDENDGTFALAQEYTTLADGSSQAQLAVTGKLPVNDFITDAHPPAIRSVTSASTGGSLAGDRDYFLAVCAKDTNGKFSSPSNVVSIHVPAGTNANKITLDSIVWPVGTFDGYVVFASVDDGRMMCRQAEGTGTPSSVEVTGPFARSRVKRLRRFAGRHRRSERRKHPAARGEYRNRRAWALRCEP
ncbi:MAG: hypothetical protein HY313_08245, partial [Acidobacteria bacterium]|nr:hypothetical protein [Acidobacteriota bacterium]